MRQILHKFNILRLLTMLAAIIATSIGNGAWAESKTEEIVFSKLGYQNGEKYLTTTQGDVTVTFAGGDNDGKYYNTDTGMRIYSGGSATFTANGKNITYVKLVFASRYAPASGDQNEVWSQEGKTECSTSSNDCYWKGSYKSVSITRPSVSGQWRLQTVEVTYDAGDASKKDVTISFTGETNEYEVNIGETFTAPTATANVEGLTVTYSSSDEDVATVNASTGAVTIVAAGETTITASTAATDTYNAGSASYTITVIDPNVPGSENNPYTVAQARAAIDAGTGITSVYAKGIVSKIVTAYNSQYGNITYNISADGTTDGDQLQAYRGKSYNGANFNSEDDIQVGDEVVIYGNLKKYNSTYEFDQNNQLVSLNRSEKQDAGLSFGETTEFTITLGDNFTAPTLINPNNIQDIVYMSSNVEVASVDPGTGAVTVSGVGETTITVSFRGNDTYKAGSASYTLTVESNKQASDLAITAPESTTLTVGDELQLTYTTSADGELTWESSNDAVLTVDEEGTVTAVAAGTATITLTQAASNTYDGAEATIEFTVKKATPAGTVADVLDRDLTEVTGTTYSEWSKSVSSEAVYAGNSAGGYESIQLRSNNNSGIVSTTSGGSIFSVEVEWNDNTTAGRTLNVYGSNTAYESAADLYDSSMQGTLLGTIVYNDGEPTSLEIDGDYEYVGVRSNSGAMYLTSVTFTWATSGKASAGFSFGETTAFNVQPNAEFTAPTLTTAEGFDGTIVYSSSDEDIALVDESTGDVVIGEKEGTATITASAEATDNFKAGSASYTITVKAPEKAENGLAFDKESVEANIGEDFSAPALTNPNQLTVTYSSSNENLATVDESTGEVTIGTTVGSVTITATFAGNNDFKAGSVSYAINIIDPNNQPTYYALVADLGNGNGMALSTTAKETTALEGKNVNIVNGKVVNGKATDISWEITEASNYKTVRTTDGKYLVHGTADKNTDLKVSESTTGNKWETTDKGDFGANLGRAQAIQWSTQNTCFKNYAGTSNGYYAVSQYTFTDGYVREELTAGNWGTFCADHAIAADDYNGVTFYSIAGKVVNVEGAPTGIVLTEVDGALNAGEAYIFKVNEEANKLVAAYSEESAEAPIATNGLVGSFTRTDVAEDMYLLSGGKVVKCGTGCNIAANRAYIDMSQVPVVDTSVAGVKLGIGDITVGIDGIQSNGTTGSIYNIAGQRMSKLQRGLNIVDGKKILVK